MPRTARIVMPGLPHHVILRGNNRRRIFSYPKDYMRFLWDLARAVRQTGVQVHALALMANHVHLIVTPPDAAALGELVKRTAQRYAQRRNLQRASSGKLFEERYRCVPVRDDEQLAAATAYVDLNAYRAGIVDDPAAHPWSTYRLHAGLAGSAVPASPWTPSPWYLTLGATPAARAAAYRELAARRAREMRDALAATSPTASPPWTYTRRLERPDRTRAAEGAAPPWLPQRHKPRGREKNLSPRATLRGRNVSPSW